MFVCSRNRERFLHRFTNKVKWKYQHPLAGFFLGFRVSPQSSSFIQISSVKTLKSWFLLITGICPELIHFAFYILAATKCEGVQSNSSLLENKILTGSAMKQTPPSLHSLDREKRRIPHLWFHTWLQKSKFGSSRAGGEDRRGDFLFHPSQFIAFSCQRRKNFPTFSTRALGKVLRVVSLTLTFKSIPTSN